MRGDGKEEVEEVPLGGITGRGGLRMEGSGWV